MENKTESLITALAEFQVAEYRSWLKDCEDHDRYCLAHSVSGFTKEESDSVELDRR